VDREAIRFLQSSAGRAAIESIATDPPADDRLLSVLTDLRRDLDPGLAAAVVETARLRVRARSKFSRADRMLFDRHGLEQATSEAVARVRAERFAEAGVGTILDLGCGVGGDALALASVGGVVGIDVSPVRVALAAHNVSVYGGVFHGVVGNAVRPCWERPPDAVFIDPARRSDRGRTFDPSSYQPSLAAAIDIAREARIGAIKSAPGIEHSSIPEAADAEFVSAGGEMKECVLWFGAGRRGIPTCATVVGVGRFAPSGPADSVPVGTPGPVLFEPDPAVIRAGLVRHLAAELGAWMIDDRIAYLSSSRVPSSPFGRAYLVESVVPFSLKRLRSHLRALDVGSVTIKKRGSPIEPETLRRRLRLEGSGHRVVILTRIGDDPTVIIGTEADPPAIRDQRSAIGDGDR
jgi:hypothetical protein